MHKLAISTGKREEITDITGRIRDFIEKNKCRSGLLAVYSPHTTAGISVNENYDPDVKRDITAYLNATVPADFGFRHAEGNSDAHIKGALVNFSQVFIVEDGQIRLGTWQGVFFMEFDGPRRREVWLQFIPA